MKFFVFSYNRGIFLDNCIRSIENCAPNSTVTIFDDNSTDDETVSILSRLQKRHRVISNIWNTANKHGGLYDNMQQALTYYSDENLICFLQDDTQLVRSLEESDEEFIQQKFAQTTRLGFITPAFIRGSSARRKHAGNYIYDRSSQLYYWHDDYRSAGVFYSDIFISSAERLKQHDWNFAAGEPDNEKQARQKFTRMAYLPVPFLMWLPYGPVYRGKQKTYSLRLAEHINHCGFYPLAYMSDTEVEKLRKNTGVRPPIAEDWLRPESITLPIPWIYNPLQKNRLLRLTNKIELFISRQLY